MNPHVNTIANRLSLRPPQRDSLEILARLGEIIPLRKGADVAAALEVVRSEFPSVEAFERDFPSLCFALATGVGKTRLMGAFISYLYRAHGIRHFFVLAPNLTIYNKLITDFTPNTPKYVFQGIGEFAQTPPEIITGDNYESGRGVRDAARLQPALPGLAGEVHINIFNISKINSEVRGGNAPRIKRLSEYIGESYFDYLARLDDLVLLMDESHRYRAAAGVQAINELNPILGLELTATPQVERGQRAVRFQNVIYSYPLASAMRDGFVKEPAVATRENFDAAQYDEAGLERLKLEDGVRIHENTKVELAIFARDNGQPIVKPFMLVVAQDTVHAEQLLRQIEDDSFFEGRYRGKVITVHSNRSGAEQDEIIEQLLSVEDRNNPVEIVIHVNMLKEGWDVTNLYTIVPLRAANSKTLVEQSIGRGLRLPFGRRTGVAAVDRLTIVSHDRFQEIVDDANHPDSIIRTGVIIGKDIPSNGRRIVDVQPVFMGQLTGNGGEMVLGGAEQNGADGAVHEGGLSDGAHVGRTTAVVAVQTPLFYTPKEQRVVQVIMEVIENDYEVLATSAQLQTPAIQQAIAQKVMAAVQLPVRGVSGGIKGEGQIGMAGIHVDVPTLDEVAAIVDQTTRLVVEKTIDIPRIVVVPSDEAKSGFHDFDLDVSVIHLQPVDSNILIQHLQSNQRHRLSTNPVGVAEARPEDYIVRSLMDYDDVNYDQQADLLYKLAGQVVARLRSYLHDEADVENVLQYYEKQLADLVHSQMQAHYYEDTTSYIAHVSKGFTTLRAQSFAMADNQEPRDFRHPLDEKRDIRAMLFGGFQRCVYPYQKFDTDSERRFAVLLENEEDPALKWLKPSRQEFQIYYDHDRRGYEPDFVVETAMVKYICEPKRADQMQQEDVRAKARAAITWCQHATAHARQVGGKPWRYLLIPHDAIQDNMTLAGLAARFGVDT